MKRATKIGLIIGGIVVAGVTTGILVARSKEKKKEEERRKKADAEAKERELEQSLATEQSGVSTQDDERYKGYVIPKRNRNGEIINPFKEVKGKMLYPAIKSDDVSKGYPFAQGKANLRYSAEVNNGTINNLLKTFTSGSSPIGTVLSTKKDNFDPAMRWFYVKLKKPCCGTFSDYTKAWVRADVVTFRKYKKSSSAEGDMDGMVEHYDTTYQLGAQVFPHSTWENPIEMFSGMEGREFEPSELLNDL